MSCLLMSKKSFDWHREPTYNISMDIKEAREILKVRDQILEDLNDYLEGITNCFPAESGEEDLITDVCNIVVRNFDKLG